MFTKTLHRAAEAVNGHATPLVESATHTIRAELDAGISRLETRLQDSTLILCAVIGAGLLAIAITCMWSD